MIASKKLFILISCLPAILVAGIAIIGDIPDSVHKLIEQKHQELFHSIQKINQAQEDQKYKFEAFGFSPHMTISYITQEELSLKEVYEREPKLKEMLLQVSGLFACIDLTENAQKSYPEFWKGKFECITLDGSTKKNYYNIVLKMLPSEKLTELADKLDIELKNYKLYCGRRFPFSAHFSIGRIYAHDDSDVTEVVQKIKSKFEQKVQLSEDFSTEKFILDSFKLSGHDKATDVFSLKK